MKTSLYKNKNINKKGFSLMEMIVAIFIFSLIMTTVASIFVQTFNARKKAKEIQTNIEDTRSAMELMAKTLRMSSVIAYGSDYVLAYDYSQNKCIRYFQGGGDIRSAWLDGVADISGCTTGTPLGSSVSMTAGYDTGFSVNAEKSDKTTGFKKIGKVTIAMTICADTKTPCKTEETIQTTVSLRDYGYLMN